MALSVIKWTFETWRHEWGSTGVFCRRDEARLVMALRVELGGQDHPVGRAVERVYQAIVDRCAELIDAGRRRGSIPPGPPVRVVALAFVGAVEGAVIQLDGQAPYDELLAVRTAAGVLGLDTWRRPCRPRTLTAESSVCHCREYGRYLP